MRMSQFTGSPVVLPETSARPAPHAAQGAIRSALSYLNATYSLVRGILSTVPKTIRGVPSICVSFHSCRPERAEFTVLVSDGDLREGCEVLLRPELPSALEAVLELSALGFD
jgi:hypothetical protein